MDPLSHVALGAVAAQPRASRAQFVAAGLAGTLGALAPDLDLLIRSASDPLLFLEMHRQFTHSLAFAPIGALIVAALLRLALGARLTLAQLWLCCVIGYLSHVLLDAMTTYGVELWWPFSSERVAFSVISAFDPAFTLPLAALAVLAAVRRSRRVALGAAGWGLAYLAFAAMQAERARAAAITVAETRGHEAGRLMVAPSFANTLVWKTLYEHGGRYYVDAIRTGAGTPRLYAGESVQALDAQRDLGWLEPGSPQARDLARFRFVAGGYLALDPHVDHRVIELRYSLVPNRIEPYWAVELEPSARQARFVTTRAHTPAQGLELLNMVLGRTPGVPVDDSLTAAASRSERLP